MTDIDRIRAARAQALDDAAALLETRAAELRATELLETHGVATQITNATIRYAAHVLQYAAESIRKLKEEQS